MGKVHKNRRMVALRATLVLACVLCTTFAYSAPKAVLVLGDSLSAEYGLVRGTGWVTLMENQSKSEKIDVRIINASISGETTIGGKNRLPSLLDQHHPAVVVIELGGNDGLRGLPLAAIKENLEAMITSSQQARAKVLLVGMQIPPNYGRDYANRFFATYAALSQEKKTPLVPFLLEGISTQQHFFQSDGIHPTAAAQPLILNNVWPHIKRLLMK